MLEIVRGAVRRLRKSRFAPFNVIIIISSSSSSSSILFYVSLVIVVITYPNFFFFQVLWDVGLFIGWLVGWLVDFSEGQQSITKDLHNHYDMVVTS